MPKDELLQTSQYLAIVSSKTIKREPSNELQINTPITSSKDFAAQLQTVCSQSKNPMFINVKISDAELSLDTQAQSLVLLDEVELTKATITSNITGVIAPKAKVKQSILTGELNDNNFQQGLFTQTVFEKAVKTTDFQGASFVLGRINHVDSCNFTNANCTKTNFSGNISGFTCFAGADLTNAVFTGTIGKTVCFIGSNFDVNNMNNSAGGIYTVNQLKSVITEYSDEDLKKLEMILSESYKQVEAQVTKYTARKMAYHVNIHHVDAINQARVAVSNEIENRNGHSVSAQI